VKLITLIVNIVRSRCIVWNLYGPAETTIASTFHLVDVSADRESIPIGLPLSNYRCLVVDDFLQHVTIGQEGELFVGGVGVFAGYLGRDDLTTKALIKINDELFYRTGDLVRIDNHGLLHYKGRKDHQIKLHGQRIELGEIERCLLNTSISNCIVIKWNDDHLIAYVQTSHINQEQLRKHCQSHLPPHMIPSMFIVLDKLPLNANGKVDRKLLPQPDFSQLTPSSSSSHPHKLPTNQIEMTVHNIWCDILQQNQISIDRNIFTIGGHSLLVIELFHRYKVEFHLGFNSLALKDVFQYSTITDHSRLIEEAIGIGEHINDCWSPLHIIQGEFYFGVASL
jgi:hypothetical protein